MAGEPRLTEARFRGDVCGKCGTHVRRRSDGYCIHCAQAPTESIRRSKRDWHRRNYDKSYAIKKAWEKRNPGAVAKRNIDYESATKQQTPLWANLQYINRIYVVARALGMTVDHFYPLQGATVCGLHVETNLRIVTRSENASKKNKHPDEASGD